MKKYSVLALVLFFNLLAKPVFADTQTEKKEPKINYFVPIFGGAILGIGLAIWLRRKK